MLDAKSILLSKTLWVNVLGLAGVIAGFLPSGPAAIALPIINLLMRAITNQPVTFTLPAGLLRK